MDKAVSSGHQFNLTDHHENRVDVMRALIGYETFWIGF